MQAGTVNLLIRHPMMALAWPSWHWQNLSRDAVREPYRAAVLSCPPRRHAAGPSRVSAAPPPNRDLTRLESQVTNFQSLRISLPVCTCNLNLNLKRTGGTAFTGMRLSGSQACFFFPNHAVARQGVTVNLNLEAGSSESSPRRVTQSASTARALRLPDPDASTAEQPSGILTTIWNREP
jgi:hypothetical protein